MFQKEHKQTSISRNAIFTTGSMRASKLLPSIILTFFILLADFNFEIGKEIKSMVLNIFKPINEASLNIESFSNQISLFFTLVLLVNKKCIVFCIHDVLEISIFE